MIYICILYFLIGILSVFVRCRLNESINVVDCISTLFVVFLWPLEILFIVIIFFIGWARYLRWRFK